MLASEAYGKVSPEKFDELRDEARGFRRMIEEDEEFTSTLREDWDIGTTDGGFSVTYGALCTTCGFRFSFKHEEKLNI